MTKTKWWMRVVGAFYTLLALFNLWALFFNPQVIANDLPYPAGPDVVRAFADAWLVFVLEFGVLGVMLLYASRDPARSRILVMTVVLAELFRGIVADAIWIARGFSAAAYIPFIVVHLIIIVTGIWFLRQESAPAAV